MNYRISIFILLFLLIGCNKSDTTVEGRIIEFKFGGVEKIEGQSWVKVDDYKFVHFNVEQDIKEGGYSLPATTIRRDTSDEANRISVNPRAIARYMGLYLQNISKEKEGTGYIILEKHRIPIDGVLKIAKFDSSKITVQVSEGYPVKINKKEI